MKIHKYKNINKAIEKIRELSENKVVQEICGLFGKDGDHYLIEECKNISKDPRNTFALDPLQFLLFKDKYEIIALFHSHVIGNEDPSEFDVLMSENSCIPFLIYALNTKKISLYIPEDPEVDFKTIKITKEKINDHNKKSWNFS